MRIVRGSSRIPGWCKQKADQRPYQALSTRPRIVNEREETRVQRQALLRNSSMRTKPAAQQRPEPFQRVHMHLAEPVPVVISGIFPLAVADRVMAKAPILETAVDVVLIRVDHAPGGDCGPDQRPKRLRAPGRAHKAGTFPKADREPNQTSHSRPCVRSTKDRGNTPRLLVFGHARRIETPARAVLRTSRSLGFMCRNSQLRRDLPGHPSQHFATARQGVRIKFQT